MFVGSISVVGKDCLKTVFENDTGNFRLLGSTFHLDMSKRITFDLCTWLMETSVKSGRLTRKR